MSEALIAAWHKFMQDGDQDLLSGLLADDCTFVSPIVHTPQRGKALSFAYLSAAQALLGGPGFEYLRAFDCGDRAVLEFGRVLDGIEINGVDMIEWNEAGKIVDFKVMVRPKKAAETVHQAMGTRLAKMQSAGSNRAN